MFPTPTPLRTRAQLLLSPHVLYSSAPQQLSNRLDVVNVTAYSSIDGRRVHRAPLPTLSLVFYSIWVRFYPGDKYRTAISDLKVAELLLASGMVAGARLTDYLCPADRHASSHQDRRYCSRGEGWSFLWPILECRSLMYVGRIRRAHTSTFFV